MILLVRKGTDKIPATTAEVQALASQVRQIAKVPLIVGDHRLSVEIVTPKTDNTLSADKYSTLDTRISARLYQMFTVGSTSHGIGRDDSLKLARVVARGMESRRHMLKRAIEKHVLWPMYEANDELTEPPELTFHPKRIALDFDPAVAAFLQDLRDRGDISRESILEELDYSQATEARNRVREAEIYDQIFYTQNPWGGTPAGGPQSQQTMYQAPQVPQKPKTRSAQNVKSDPRTANETLPKRTPGGPPKGTAPKSPSSPSAQRRAGRRGGNHNGGGAAGGALGQGRQKNDIPDGSPNKQQTKDT
jgi:hypothetical protein